MPNGNNEAKNASQSKLDLCRNAYDFLNESIRNAERGSLNAVAWKFAIVNIAQAIELLLKERVRREHELLVYVDIDRQRHTITVDQALSRLENCGITFEAEDIARLKRARDIRNNIVHYDIQLSDIQLQQSYVDLFEFVHVFHLECLGEEVHNHIEHDLWILEAELMEEFRRDFVRYQGAELSKTFPSEILSSQFIIYYRINDQLFKRIRWQGGRNPSYPDCRDCGVLPGQLHTPGCHNETCPHCGIQWISCDYSNNYEPEFVEQIESWFEGTDTK